MSWRDDAYRAFSKWAAATAEDIAELTPEVLERYIAHLRSNNTPKTRMTRLHGLQGALRERLPAGVDLTWLERRVREEWTMSGLGRRGHGPGRGHASMARRHRLLVAEWPSEVRERWERATRGPEPAGRRRYSVEAATDGSAGAAVTWAAATRDKVARVIGLLLRIAQEQSLPLDVVPESVQAFIDYHTGKENSLYGLACNLDHLAMAGRVMWPERDWDWLTLTSARLHAVADQQPRKRDLSDVGVVPFEVEALGWKLLGEAVQNSVTARSAGQYRDGLLILFLLHHPVRRRNLAEMRVGEHLLPDDHGFRLAWAETKNKQPRVDRLADRLVEPMRTYLQTYRPALHNSGSGDALWLSASNDTLGSPLTAGSLLEAIAGRVKRRLGGHVWAHLFRHWGAMMVIDHRAADSHLIAPLLGHRDPRSARFYISLAKTRGASSRLADMVERFYRPRKHAYIRRPTLRKADRA